MESDKIEKLLEKYFEGATSIDEENVLRNYFVSLNVPLHLEHYKQLFGYFSNDREQQFTKLIPMHRKYSATWLSVAASAVVLLGIGTYEGFQYKNTAPKSDLGTYNDPEVAFKETQKALSMLSGHVNQGIESIQYVKEYETAKSRIFRE